MYLPSYGYYYYNYYFPYHLSRGTYFFGTIIGLITIVALWFIFQKAKEEGWAAVIPFYNTYVLFKITWGNGWYFLLLLIPIANIVIYIITMVKLSKAFGKGGGWACGLIFLYPIFLCIMAFDKSIVYVGNYAGTAGSGGGAGTGAAGGDSGQTCWQQQQQQSAQDYPRFCPNCGSPVSSGDKFCLHCGHPL